MIISASRRTDIPAFFGEWFVKRLLQGFAMFRNPMRPTQVFAISLFPEDVDAIVFWTKNPKPFLEKLEYLKDYTYYFQFTLNPYDTDLEPNLPDKNVLIDTFIRLSDIIGPKRVIWRYDPIIITPRMDMMYHLEKFEELCEKLSKFTTKCIISYVDFYKSAVPSLEKIKAVDLSDDEKLELFYNVGQIAKKYGLSVETCAEAVDVEKIGLRKAHCIDGALIEELRGKKYDFKKDKNQRLACGCVQSVDVGIFNTCMHFCAYCYANYNRKAIEKNVKEMFDENSPLLCSRLDLTRDEIRIRIEDKSYPIKLDEILHYRKSENEIFQRSFVDDKDDTQSKLERIISKLKRSIFS